MALLEVIVAITVFATAGLSAVAWAGQTTDAVTRARSSVVELRAASDYLDRVALWTREDLDRHLGARRQGQWTVRVDRPAPVLYDVSIADSTDARTLLSTTLYRPEAPHAAP